MLKDVLLNGTYPKLSYLEITIHGIFIATPAIKVQNYNG